MKLVRIFVSDKTGDGVWAIQLKHEQQNEFDKFFNLINDPLMLHQFFHDNIGDLENGFFGTINISEAVIRTIEEAEKLEDLIYDFSRQGFAVNEKNLQYLFQPLNNFEYGISTHQKSKSKARKSWLRLYAIRLAQNCYVVTGGGIKLTVDMKRDHLQHELNKLERVKFFLRENGIDYPEDLNLYQHE